MIAAACAWLALQPLLILLIWRPWREWRIEYATSVLEHVLCWILPYTDIPAPDGRLYLRRWHLWPLSRRRWSKSDRAKWCLHKICLSDEDRDPHTHPSGFTTRMLRGGYTEMVYKVDPVWGRLLWRKRDVTPGMRMKNPADHIHRVLLHGGRPAWTLVRMERAEHEWGFVRHDGGIVPVDQYRASLARERATASGTLGA